VLAYYFIYLDMSYPTTSLIICRYMFDVIITVIQTTEAQDQVQLFYRTRILITLAEVNPPIIGHQSYSAATSALF